MATTFFNTAQLEMLKMMSRVTDAETLDELKLTISNFFAHKAQEEIDLLWKKGKLTDEKVESFRNLHERTSYK